MWEFKVLIGERIPKNSHVSFFSFLWDLNFLVSFAVFLIKKKELIFFLWIKGCVIHD
jgi:hypothetical protein